MIGVGGCVAQQEGSRLLERAEFLDFVFGTHALFDLPEIIGDLSSGSGARCFTDFTYRFDRPEWEKVKPPNKKITALVTIMRGCNNFCTFCVVPHVRGREMSRTLAAILGETESAIQTGTREVTLLGQNVNSYQSPDGEGGFVTLLGALNRLEVSTEFGSRPAILKTCRPNSLNASVVWKSSAPTSISLCRAGRIPYSRG